ncbi:MAG TPA: aspartyl/asparaginyl beta-hydroxylase domain-containing protein [Flavisolibacter sp.]|nr:aspartyl/asparaginyl beta-hydroxylase domain-containing protein [Flavisolibacter sp.]
MLKYAQLSTQFGAERMKAEVALLEASFWKQHYNKKDYKGEWSVLPLRSINGDTESIYAVASGSNMHRYADTPLLQHCPYLQEVLSFFQCEKTAVRLMKLNASSTIEEHRDTALNFEDGEARLHIPVATNSQVVFFLEKEPLYLQEGECWYLNLSLPHSVQNNGLSDRVHLVIDCVVNDWLRNQITAQATRQKREEAKAPGMDNDSRQKMIAELRRMNTTVALELAAKLEKEST